MREIEMTEEEMAGRETAKEGEMKEMIGIETAEKGEMREIEMRGREEMTETGKKEDGQNRTERHIEKEIPKT